MEHVEGKDLATLLHEGGRLTDDAAVKLVITICEALDYAHNRGVLHRDIKPANILVNNQLEPKLADFGLAKFINKENTQLTYSSTTVGTPEYIAPECHTPGASVDQRADIYSTTEAGRTAFNRM